MNDSEILDRLEKFYTRVNGSCSEIVKAYADDIDFGLLGKQWDETKASERKDANRLTLTINRLKQFIYQVVNDYKQAEMTSKVLPHDTSEKDKILAEVRRGIMRSLERKKGGLNAYNNAAKTLVAGGLGGWRINTREIDPMEFDQEPYFLPILDMSTVIIDYEGCQEPDYSDMMDCVVQEKYSKTAFESKFGKKAIESLGSGSVNGVWGTQDGPCVSDYWFKEEISETLCMVDPNARQIIPGLKKTAYLSDLKKVAEKAGVLVEVLMQNDPETGKPIQRPTKRCKVWSAQVAAKQVLEKQEWPIDLIPVVIVTGRKTVNKGKTTIEGLIRQSKDAQRSYNYVKSNKTERIAQAPRNPFFVPEGGIPAGKEKAWARMNVTLDPYLTFNAYHPVMKDKPLPPPHRLDPINVDSALVEEERAAQEEIKATVGMDDPAVGKLGKERSGVALKTLDRNADTNNYDFTESMVIGIKYSTKVLNKLIPKVIDTPRQVSIVGEDDKEKVIWVNQQNPDGTEYNVTEGEFDIDYEAGPSSATKTDQAREDLLGLTTAMPQMGLVTGPSIIRNSQIRGNDELADAAERFANTQIPGLFPEKQGQAPDPNQLMGQLQQMQAQLQQMMPEMQKLQQENAKLTIQNQAITADKQIEGAKLGQEQEKIRLEWFKAETDRMGVAGTLKDKTDNTKIKAVQALHAGHKDAADHGLKAQAQAHGQHMEKTNLAVTVGKNAADHSLQVSAQQQKAAADKATATAPKAGNADGKR